MLSCDVPFSGCRRLKGGAALVTYVVGLFGLRDVCARRDRQVALEADVVQAASPSQESLLILFGVLRAPPHGFGLSLPCLRVLLSVETPSAKIVRWFWQVWEHAEQT